MTAASNTLPSMLTGLATAVLLGGASLLGLQDPARAIIPAYTTSGAVGTNTGTTPYLYSFGFYFDVNSNLPINALGFSSQPGWPTGSSDYAVAMWKWVNGGNTSADYTPVTGASVLFKPGLPYTFQDGYFWKSIPEVTLTDTVTGDPTNQTGYVIAAIGDFDLAPAGNVLAELSGPGTVVSYLPQVIVSNTSPLGGGFNSEADTGVLWPYPAYSTLPFPQTVSGYYNPNFSVVPGPLPILGAGAGLAWSRRLRRRIKSFR